MLVKNKFQLIKEIIFIIFIISFVGCSGNALFTELATNRLQVVLKGTYASNNPRDWNFPGADDSAVQDDSVDDCSGSVGDVSPTLFMLDIAELRLVDENFKNQAKFGNYDEEPFRHIFEFNLNNSEPFFNGTGVEMRNEDVSPDIEYSYVRLYIRKMIFDEARRYQTADSGWEAPEDEDDKYVEAIFQEEDVRGFDFNQFQTNTYYDSLLVQASEINQVFPLTVPIIGGLQYSTSEDNVVLEIRLVIKNFVKKYEYDYNEDGVYKVIHYYALSDWLRDVQAGERAIGGNILAVARAYVPDEAGGISGINSGAAGYIIAVPAGDPITDYTIPPDPRGDNECDLPAFPQAPDNYIELFLDYYLKLEKYKEDWNSQVPLTGTCDSYETYQDEWETYESTVGDFLVPPLAVWNAGGGLYTIENIPPGDYDVYRADAPSYGELFVVGDFTAYIAGPGNPVTVTEGSIETGVDFP